MTDDTSPNSETNDAAGVPSPRELGTGRVSHVETALIWRMSRYVLNEGHPAANNVLVSIQRPSGEFPLLGFTLTNAPRLVCWPVLPDIDYSESESVRTRLTDHITLDLRNRKSHSTYFDPLGGKEYPREWSIQELPCNGVSFWFGFAVQLSTIEKQVLERHQWIRMPKSDAKRRTDEFKQVASRLRAVQANTLAPNGSHGNAMIGLVYVCDRREVSLSQEMAKLSAKGSEDFWDGPLDAKPWTVVSTGFAVGSAQLGLLLGYPSSNLKVDDPVLFTPRVC